MDTDASPALLPTGLPETWAMPNDVACPACRYNLRMLRTPRCPECGRVFRWQALLRVHCPRCGEDLSSVSAAACPRCALALDWTRMLETAAPQSERLYEYTHRPISRALGVCAAALRPGKFWRSMRLEDIPVVQRLRSFRLFALSVCVIGIALPTAVLLTKSSYPLPLLLTRTGSGSPLRVTFTTAGPGWGALLAPCMFALLPLLITTVLMPVFSPTLATFRIRRDQMLRLLAYSCVGPFWIGVSFGSASCLQAASSVLRALLIASLPATPTAAVWVSYVPPIEYRPEAMLVWLFAPGRFYANAIFWFNLVLLLGLALLAFIWWWVFLYAGLRAYLRLDRANAVALFLSTQTIAVLALMCALVACPDVHSPVGELLMRLLDQR